MSNIPKSVESEEIILGFILNNDKIMKQVIEEE